MSVNHFMYVYNQIWASLISESLRHSKHLHFSQTYYCGTLWMLTETTGEGTVPFISISIKSKHKNTIYILEGLICLSYWLFYCCEETPRLRQFLQVRIWLRICLHFLKVKGWLSRWEKLLAIDNQAWRWSKTLALRSDLLSWVRSRERQRQRRDRDKQKDI